MSIQVRRPKLILLQALVALGVHAEATTIEKVDFVETMKVDDVELKLNGVGLRKVERFGLPFKVYVAGLYLKVARSDANEILESEDPKFLRMVFVRRVNAPDLVDGFEKGHASNCLKDCEQSKKILRKLTDKISDILDKGSMEFVFKKDKLEYAINGRKSEKGSIDDKVFAKNFLATFIGKEPPTPDLKQGLLGLKRP